MNPSNSPSPPRPGDEAKPPHSAKLAQKFDFDTPLERALHLGAIVFGCFAANAAFSYFSGDSEVSFFGFSTRGLDAEWVLLLNVLAALVLVFVRWNFKAWYLFHPESKEIFAVRKFFGMISHRTVASFSEVSLVTVDGKWVAGDEDSPGYYSYRAILVTGSGKKIPISDWEDEDFFVATSIARSAAKLTESIFTRGSPESYCRVVRRGGQVGVESRPIDFFRRNGLRVLAVVIFVTIFFGFM